jgi:hypothetical protein
MSDKGMDAFIKDALGDRSHLTPEQRAEREANDARDAGERRVGFEKCTLTILNFVELIATGRADESEITDYLRMIWNSGVNTGREMELIHHRWSLRKLGGFCDTGDGVPLAVIGQGDFERRINP